MWIYAHWQANGTGYLMPFHKQEKAADHAFSRLHSQIAHEVRNYTNKTMPKELTELKLAIEQCDGNRTVENAKKIIDMYERFLRIVGNASMHHSLEDIKLVE
jgi:site-specific recombinase